MRVLVGCECHDIEDWLANFEEIGKKNGVAQYKEVE